MSPVRSHVEFERKFLVRRLPNDLESYPHAEIEQGYLAIAPGGVQVRLRRSARERTLTFKRGKADGREEREISLTPEQFDALWPGTEGKRLLKTRYDVALGECLVEIDVYAGRNAGVIVAEVEFPDAASARAFAPPDWLGDDVTHDPRYSNQLLACGSGADS